MEKLCIVALKTKKKQINSLFVLFLLLSWNPGGLLAQGIWAAKAPLPAIGRFGAVAFTIGSKGYLGTGYSSFSNVEADFWEYDPLVNTWTQKANFGGGPRGVAVGFSIGNYAYIGTGLDMLGNYNNDFWKYDPVANTWSQVASVGGSKRRWAFGFSSATKGYIGTGQEDVSFSVLQDLWEYDPVSNTWIPKTNYWGGGRCDIDRAIFVICNKAYLGTGRDDLTYYNDFWEYNPASDTWTQKANFPGTPRIGAIGFSIGGRGFLGLGLDNTPIYNTDFWKYNPFTNSWSSQSAFPGGGRYDLPAFVINNKAYLGTGLGNGFNFYKDLWEFTPDSIINSATATILSSANTICAGQSVTLLAGGGGSYLWNNGSTNNAIIVSPTITTTYSVNVSDTTVCGGSDMATVTISITNVTAFIFCQNMCAGGNTTLLASGGTNYLWSTGAITSSITVSPSATTIYTAIVSTGSCADTTNCMVNVFPTPILTSSGTDVSCNGGNDGTALVAATGGSPPYNYLWSPTGGVDSLSVGLNTGTYFATVTDANGCKQVETITISEPELVHLAVPNAFSPNSDGENDNFCLQGDSYCIKELKIIIYDRWGDNIYKSTDTKFCWDGTYNNKQINTAVFVYYLEVILIDGKRVAKKGNINLVR